jgi:AcrR family transcriptional regulator
MTGTVITRYDLLMGRWEPNARGRLEQAALELYREHGFDSTTVAEIAERAGLTERTFFRHYADKREVLFGGAGMLQDMLVTGVREAPAELPPMEAIITALVSVADGLFEERRDFARQRQAVIAGNTELQEREVVKLATLAAAVAGALRERGVGDPAASLAAESGIAIFKIAFERWTGETTASSLSLAQVIRESMDELIVVTAARPPAARR